MQFNVSAQQQQGHHRALPPVMPVCILLVFGSCDFVDRPRFPANRNDPRIHTKEHKTNNAGLNPTKSRSAIDERAHLANVRIQRVNAVENYFDGLVWKSRLKCERVTSEDIAGVVRAPIQEIVVG